MKAMSGIMFKAVAVAVGAAPSLVAASAEEVVYVVNSYVHGVSPDRSTLVMLRSSDLEILDTLTLGDDAHSVAVNHDRSRVWVTCKNSVNLEVTPSDIGDGETASLSWECDFSEWNYEGVPVDIYLATMRYPAVEDVPCSVADALAAEEIWFYGPNMDYAYTGDIREPTFSNVSSPRRFAPAGSSPSRRGRESRANGSTPPPSSGATRASSSVRTACRSKSRTYSHFHKDLAR